MKRGRRAQPDELKALKGNPGKRALHTAPEDKLGVLAKAPDYVSSKLEREIFSRVAGHLNHVRFVRNTDADVLGRWCVYLARWIDLKKRLDAKDADVYYETASKHGTMLRVHPLFASMFKIEQHLMALEDRIGLNPTSRQSVLRGLINAPAIPPSDLFGDGAQKPAPPTTTGKDQKAPADMALSPLGFLAGPKH